MARTEYAKVEITDYSIHYQVDHNHLTPLLINQLKKTLYLPTNTLPHLLLSLQYDTLHNYPINPGNTLTTLYRLLSS
jgi:hypothetical protein